MECVFCSDDHSRRYALFETPLFRVVWDTHPSSPGHMLVTPKRHVQYVEDLLPDEAAQLMPTVQRAIDTVCKTDLVQTYETLVAQTAEFEQIFFLACLEKMNAHHGAPEGFTIGIDDGHAAGQSVPHLHVHVIPRWSGDIAHSRGSVRQVIGMDMQVAGERR